MASLLKIQFKDTRRFGLKLWPTKKLTRKQKEVYLKKIRRKSYKQSFFCRQLFQKQKISLFYGKLSYRPFHSLLKKLNTLRGDRLKNFFLTMEKRLDVLCFRMKFFSTLGLARQMILHKKILLNGQPANFSQINVKIGDIISIHSSVFHQVTHSLHNYLKFLAILVQKRHFFSTMPSQVKKSFALKNNIIKGGKSQLTYLDYSIFFNHFLFERPVLSENLSKFASSQNPLLEKIISKKKYFLTSMNLYPNQKIIKKNSFFEKNIKRENILKSPKGHFKFSKLNAYKLPHLEINYATLTAILLPYQPNFGFRPYFPEQLSFNFIKKIS